MICVDTNYLILALVPTSYEGRQFIEWAKAGETLVTSMAAWYEFLCGPVTPPQIATMKAFLGDILPFNEPQAVVAAQLFNAAGRKRSLGIDSMIAAAAITSGAALATNNKSDFVLFEPFGLQLA